MPVSYFWPTNFGSNVSKFKLLICSDLFIGLCDLFALCQLENMSQKKHAGEFHQEVVLLYPFSGLTAGILVVLFQVLSSNSSHLTIELPQKDCIRKSVVGLIMSPQIHVYPEPHNITFFGNMIFVDVIS